jgi:triosephosphate isomerase
MIRVPFFEFGPKAYLYGQEMLDLAEYADQLAVEFDVDIIIDPQTLDIPEMVKRCKHVRVFAQHMDGISPGRGMGTLLPEALKAWGAQGALLNHAEKRLSLTELELCIRRGRELGLMTMVCADNPDQAAALAAFSPDIIVVESPAQIGAGNRGVHFFRASQARRTASTISRNIRRGSGAAAMALLEPEPSEPAAMTL